MSIRSLLAGAAGGNWRSPGSLTLAAHPAMADAQHPCFFINQWQGWHATNDHTIYIRVNMRDIYRIDLSAGSQELTWPGSYHLVSVVRGSSSVCTPLDLQAGGVGRPWLLPAADRPGADQADAGRDRRPAEERSAVVDTGRQQGGRPVEAARSGRIGNP